MENEMILLSERRARYRQILAGNTCIHPASVFDPMSARIAESLGFKLGMFAGSIASATVLHVFRGCAPEGLALQCPLNFLYVNSDALLLIF